MSIGLLSAYKPATLTNFAVWTLPAHPNNWCQIHRRLQATTMIVSPTTCAENLFFKVFGFPTEDTLSFTSSWNRKQNMWISQNQLINASVEQKLQIESLVKNISSPHRVEGWIDLILTRLPLKHLTSNITSFFKSFESFHLPVKWPLSTFQQYGTSHIAFRT